MSSSLKINLNVMKKLVVVIVTFLMSWVVVDAQYPNPIVKRLAASEVSQCVTPAAVAYNFVESILCRDLERMLSYSDSEFTRFVCRALKDEYLTDDQFFVNYFSEKGGEKLNILGWIPALARNYEVAIAYVQDTWYYEENGSWYYNSEQIVRDGMIYLPDEEKPRVGILEKKVYVTCSPTSEVGNTGFQDITRYGNTNVKVLLIEVDGVWKVTGFK